MYESEGGPTRHLSFAASLKLDKVKPGEDGFEHIVDQTLADHSN